MQRKHKEEFLNKMSQSLHIQSTEVSRPDDINPMAQSYHFKTETSGKSNEAEMTLPSNVVPSKIMYESGEFPLNLFSKFNFSVLKKKKKYFFFSLCF